MHLSARQQQCDHQQSTGAGYDAISIYFPTFDTVAPLVNLDLRYDPIQKVVGGRKQLDMCLYDGLGSQS
ncbi:CfaE/CblD family pilus tip adhesin, partial [Chromobacterium amazonense]|uniref:CfaE/CblD family pilus tip adhesin n=1 Tax=Chromobacterium amazonense TaxID=1382803 RepID=UPI0031F660DD